MEAPQTTGALLIIEKTGQTFPLGRERVTIGRKTDNTIVLADDLAVSRHHVTIAWEQGTYIIRDFGSANGTFLNDQRMTGPQSLSNGDTIRVGETTFMVNLPEGETKITMRPELEQAKDDTRPSAPVPAGEATKVRERDPRLLPNPYVGPRTFSQEESDRFFGREREARELLSLVISERLVLFYAQSGAGKSSLINARLVPQLRDADFAVLPVGRVSGELPEGITNVDNIYIFNLLLSLDESDGDPNRFTDMSLSDFLPRLTSLDGRHYYYDEKAEPEADDETYESVPYVLIIDQFEEIITTHPARWPEREGFFRQLAQAMVDDSLLWVTLTLREDYVATLDPYTSLLPDNLRARFYMQRMSYEAALDAIKNPAEQYGRPFAAGAAESLADNLRQIRVSGVQPDIPKRTELGQFVEPVQLQVVSYQLWEDLRERPPGEITQQDLDELGDVDMALAQFYEQAINEVIRQTDVSEIELRVWFEEQLITEAGTKGLVYRGTTQTGGIDNQAVDLLRDKFLLRSEVKAGGTWYELVHDRFIEPILQSNQQWREGQPLIQVARNWVKLGRPESALLEGLQLKEVLATNWQGLGPDVREFLEASQTARKAKEEAERQHELEQAQTLAEEQQKRYEEQRKYAEELNTKNIGLRRRSIAITVVGVLAVVLAFAAGLASVEALRQTTVAETQAAVAAANEQEADNARQTAEAEAATAEANQKLAAANAAEAVAAQGTAEAESTAAAISEAEAVAQATAAAANAVAAGTILAEQDKFQTAVAEATGTKEQEVAVAAATLESQRATLTVEAATPPTPTPTNTPTDTPTPVGSPTGTGPTDTPTATASATLDANATATAKVLEILYATETSVAMVNATQTVEATARPCPADPVDEFSKIWTEYKNQLGCPSSQPPIRGQFAEQPFENGYMIWAAIGDRFFVTIGEDRGTWRFFTSEYVASVNPNAGGVVSCTPDTPPPTGLFQPVSGFGAIWCGQDEIRKEIGWATAKEFAVIDNLLQQFERGFLLRDSRNVVYVLFLDDGTYIRTR